MGVPLNSWFIRENAIEMDDWGGTPMTQETLKWLQSFSWRESGVHDFHTAIPCWGIGSDPLSLEEGDPPRIQLEDQADTSKKLCRKLQTMYNNSHNPPAALHTPTLNN